MVDPVYLLETESEPHGSIESSEFKLKTRHPSKQTPPTGRHVTPVVFTDFNLEARPLPPHRVTLDQSAGRKSRATPHFLNNSSPARFFWTLVFVPDYFHTSVFIC